MVNSYFIEYFAQKTLIILSLYPIIYVLLYFPLYKYNIDKKIYIISNIIKSLLLCYLCITYNDIIYTIFYTEQLDNLIYKKITISYAVTDFCSLLIVKNMKISTILHHIIVVLFSFIIMYTTIKPNSIFHSIIIYGLYSSLSYLVNLYLGLRFIINKKIQYILCTTSLIIYSIVCIFNWKYQLEFIFNNIFIHFYNIIIYCIVLAFLVNDDLILLQFLFKNSF